MSNERNEWDEPAGGERMAKTQAASDASGAAAVSEAQARATLIRLAEEMLVERRRSRRWRLFFRLVKLVIWLVIFAGIIWAVMRYDGDAGVVGPHVGVVEIDGVISDDSEASAERIIEGLDAAWTSSAQAVVLHINSPGGTPVQAQRIYAEVMRLRDAGDKPIYAVIEDLGASGAYYVASAAERIYASPSSLVGSIGVIHAGFGLEGAIDKLGIERRVFTAGENKDLLDPFRPVTPRQQAFWQQVLDTTHRQFVDAVKAGRGDRLADDPELFSGLVWSGEQAMSLGLVDELQSFDQVIRAQVGDATAYVDYTPKVDPLERVAQRLGVVAASFLGLELETSRSPLRYQLR
ncbi:signal peptide peptidase SppA [Halotalea alkalilenta]|uniref:Signal peptidase n=1 Tax=Halotalea alkalilenta TaxID=376489 RepID=A0A172YFA1_9GAMM|nr:signal peptide peptidase SppA [Halotalea alkalilenta]ANF57950.1 signal peptidase [Halotalea alkalilenta]